MDKIDIIIRRIINETVEQIQWENLKNNADELKQFASGIAKYANGCKESDIQQFLSNASYFSQELSNKLYQCIKHQNINEANNNGQASVGSVNGLGSQFVNDFRRGWNRGKHTWDWIYKNRYNAYDWGQGGSNSSRGNYNNGYQGMTLKELLCSQLQKLNNQYNALDKRYGGTMRNYPQVQRMLTTANDVKTTVGY